MPLPESFDINSFDNVDLWGVTRALAERMPGLHVVRILDPKYDTNKGIAFMRAFLRTRESDGQQVEFANADFRGSPEKMKALKEQVILSMGQLDVCEGVIRDEAPERTTDARLQLETAREFLPYVGSMSLSKVVRSESDGRLIRVDAMTQTMRNADLVTAATIEAHAKINVHLAALVGEDLAPYEEVVDRSATWKPIDSIPTGLDWLVR